jgi:glycosyltransferase involved in cell wall biosynthesis
MKLVLIASDPRNGLLYHPTRLALELVRRGHDVHVATRPGGREQSPGLTQQLTDAGATVHRVRSLCRSGVPALLLSSEDLRELIRSLEPDAVHVFGAVTAWQVRGSGSRCVAMIEGMGHNLRLRWPAQIGAALLNACADKVLALCEAEQQRLASLGVDRGRLFVVHNFLDCDDFVQKARQRSRSDILRMKGLDPASRYVGCFANFHPRKRQRLLLEAFASVAKNEPVWTLLLAGDGSERVHCEAQARSLGLRNKVRFLGRLPTEDAISLLAAMDAVVHCSVGETFGYSMVEPLLLERPTLVTRVAIGWELEQASVALVVAADDLVALTDGLRRLLTLDDDLLSRAATGPDFVRRSFDVSHIADVLISHYASP